MTLGRTARRVLIGCLAVGLLFGAARLWLVEVRHVPSESMVPTLLPGDRVLVWKSAAGRIPDRFDVVTFENSKGTVLVKRVIGLPGETVRIVNGDVLVDGEILQRPPALREALRTPVDRLDSIGGFVSTAWRMITIDGRSALEREAVPIVWTPPPPTAGADADPSPPPPLRARDVYLRVTAGAPAAEAVELRLVWADAEGAPEAGRTEARLVRTTSGRVRLLALDGAEASEPRVVAEAEGGGAGAGTEALELSYVDGVLRATGGALRAEVPFPVRAPALARLLVVGPVLSLTLDLDAPVTPEGKFGRGQEIHVPAGSVLVLGDHSPGSRDGRWFGPIPADRITGRVERILWPFSRWRPVR